MELIPEFGQVQEVQKDLASVVINCIAESQLHMEVVRLVNCSLSSFFPTQMVSPKYK